MSALPQLTNLPQSGAKPAAVGETWSFRCLEPDEYSVWDELVTRSPQRSVFFRSWWLKAVGEVQVLGYFCGDELIAGIPLFFERRFGINVCTMPRLTQTWGVVMPPMTGKPATVEGRQTKILRAFANALSKFRLFFQAFHPALTNWLPFYWAGFRQTTRYTYVIDNLTNLDRVWERMGGSTRGQIQKAQRAGLDFVRCGIEDVYRCEYDSHLRHGNTPAHDERILKNIFEAAQRNDSGACFGMADRSGKLHSAWLLVWDGNRAYQVIGGIADETRGVAANSLGIWRTMQFASERATTYDFTGSMIEGVARFNRGFGAMQVPYNYIIKAPTPMHFCLQLAGKL